MTKSLQRDFSSIATRGILFRKRFSFINLSTIKIYIPLLRKTLTKKSTRTSKLEKCHVLWKLDLKWVFYKDSSEYRYDPHKNFMIALMFIMLCNIGLRFFFIIHCYVHFLYRVPEYSRLHPVVPRLYTQEWKTDMKNRDLIVKVYLPCIKNPNAENLHLIWCQQFWTIYFYSFGD